MNIKKLIIGACITVTAAITLVSCEGPAGAPGPTGITGQTGAAAALPKYSAYSINDTLWTISTTVANQYTCHVNDTSMIETTTNDMVLVFAQGTTNLDYYPLPVNNILAANDMLSYSYNDTAITLYYAYTSGTTVAPTVPLNLQAVAIQPAIIKQHPNTNFNNYHEVMALMAELKAIKKEQ